MSFAPRFARVAAPVAIIATAFPAPAATPAQDLAQVERHLSAVQSMTANFTQTDQRGRAAAGTLQLKRPGRVSFKYGSGDLLLVSDGSRLHFIDYAVGQKSSWGLNKTPLGLLLAARPNLKGSARIMPNKDPRVLVARASKQPYGTLILAFMRTSSAPGGLALYGWTAVDGQGKRTTVKLSNVRYNVGVPDSAFAFREPQKRSRR